MNIYVEKLKSHIADTEPDSALEMLYAVYRELHPVNSAEVRMQFAHLNDILCKLSLRDCDEVWDLTCRLCCEHEHAAFLEGIRLGARLTLELEKQQGTVSQE